MIQTAAGARVEVRGEADHEALRLQLAGALGEVGLARPQVSVTGVGGFERQPTGKTKRFIPLPG